jgi:hypothetical protein
MALEAVGGLAVGLLAGWIGRGLSGSSRGLAVGVAAAALRARDSLSRIAGQTMEWVEDVLAEAKARHDDARDQDGAGPGGDAAESHRP